MRTIAAVSSSRADYSHLEPVLRAIQAHPALELELIQFAAHLSPEFGATGQAAIADGFPVAARIESLLSSDSDVGMAKSLGLGVLGLADALDRLRPDLLLVIADRYEMLGVGAVGTTLRIPMAHIEGGEVSSGAIDDAVRNALTKLSHLHLVPHQPAAERVIAMAEADWRVHVVGAPSLDHLQRSLPNSGALADELDLSGPGPLLLIALHPVTLATDTLEELEATFEALERVPARRAFCFPNADAGSRRLLQRARAFCDRHGGRIFVNLPAPTYFGLMAMADAMVGNSSSGIMESPSFALPCVNVGRRQAGRLCARNILSVPAQADRITAAIEQALLPQTRQPLRGMANPYGDGTAGAQIAEVLATAPGRDSLLDKSLAVLP